jgi:DNA-binding HxlR family transcriptional regulator
LDDLVLRADTTTSVEFAGLLEVLGRRWMLRVIWELRDGGLHFNELRARAGGLSQSVLVTRLGELVDEGLVHGQDGSYTLTPRGAGLADRLRALAAWSAGEQETAPAGEPAPAPAQAPAVAPRPRPGAGERPRPRPHPAP